MVKSHLLYRLSYRTTFQIEVVSQLQTETLILHIEIEVGKCDVKDFSILFNF